MPPDFKELILVDGDNVTENLPDALSGQSQK
jgi:hypothetical protein